MYNTFAILDNMIYHCWAWVNSESLRMTGTCPCVISVPVSFVKIPPMGVGEHLQGGTKGIPKTLGDNPNAPRSPYLRPSEAAPSALEARTFDLRSLRLRKEKRYFTHFKVKTANRCHPCHLVVTASI